MLIFQTHYKKVFISAVLTCAFILLSGCNSFPKEDISFESMAAPKANLPNYKTFAWLGSAAVLNDPHGYWQPSELDAEAEILFALNKGLRDRGFVEVTNRPDFVVLYATGINMQWLEFKKDNTLDKEIITNIPKAALSVVLIDVETELPIWLGSAQADLQNNLGVEIGKKRIHYAVEGILKNLPDSNKTD